MPTSVLLAVLAAAGLLALAPALVRRYDATERLVAERAMSTARVIERQRRQRTVPGRHPVNPPRFLVQAVAGSVVTASASPGSEGFSAAGGSSVSGFSGSAASGSAASSASAGVDAVGPGVAGDAAAGHGAAGRVETSQAAAAASGGDSARSGEANPVSGIPYPRRPDAPAARRSSLPPPRRRPRMHAHTPAIYRRRRVLAALVLLNVSELCGVGLVGPGFWIGSAPSMLLLAAYTVHLRKRAVEERRKRRQAVRRAAWIAARQAELRREQARRLAARREALRRAAAARAAAQRESQRLSQRYVDGSARGPLRGRAYEARAAGY
ncbi:MAG TPA: hypothetical protein VGJ07_08415 [Rugosimonospora sp.]